MPAWCPLNMKGGAWACCQSEVSNQALVEIGTSLSNQPTLRFCGLVSSRSEVEASDCLSLSFDIVVPQRSKTNMFKEV